MEGWSWLHVQHTGSTDGVSNTLHCWRGAPRTIVHPRHLNPGDPPSKSDVLSDAKCGAVGDINWRV